MKQALEKSQYQKKAILLLFRLILVCLFFLIGCDREKPNEVIDDGVSPSPPTGLGLFREYDGEVGLEWNGNLEFDISFYNIYRSIDSLSNFNKIESTTNLFYVDYPLDYDSIYYYKITAVDNSNLESGFSNLVRAQPKNIYAPFRPFGLNINARNWEDKQSVLLWWDAPFQSDVVKFHIYRDTQESVTVNSGFFIGTSENYSFVDSSSLDLLTDYFYVVVAEDKGGLTSEPSFVISDIILNKPEPILPANNSFVDYFTEFQIKTVSYPANYKIVIQSNEVSGIIRELNFSSDKVDEVISVKLSGVTFQPYRKYFWRVFTYTTNRLDPNSFSELHGFTIQPED